jgi:hypothetical protein
MAVRIRAALMILAALVLGLGIGTPLFQRSFLFAASDLGTALLWAVLAPAAVVLGAVAAGLGVWKGDSRLAGGARLAWAILCGLFACYTGYVLASMAWASFIGPTATIVLPEDYTGRFTLTMSQRVQPSLATRGQHFTYVVPGEGALHVDRGWIGLSFRFAGGASIPGGPYQVQILRKGQGPLRSDEFSCRWHGSPAIGIQCDVGTRRGSSETSVAPR